MTEIQVLTPDDWRLWRERRLQALAESPSAFGSKLGDWQGDNDREERWRQRLKASPHNLTVTVAGRPAGMASGMSTDREGVVELISMWVSPTARGHGVGDVLVASIAAWARSAGARKLILNVKPDNAPAIGLYQRNGFVFALPADRDPERDAGEETMVLELSPLASVGTRR